MPTKAELRDQRHGGAGGRHEPYQTWGRSSGTPEMQRLGGLAGQFGGQYSGALQQQRSMYDQFGALAAGQGPSLAQAQLQQGMNQAQQAATSAAMNVRGGNAAGGQAAALQAATGFGGQAAVQSAQLAQQEQLAAMQAQAGMANQMAGQGLQGQMGLEGLYQGNLGMQYQGDIDYRLGSRNARANERMGHNQRIRGNVGAATLGAAGDSSGGVLSDERAKTAIQPVTGRVDPMGDALLGGGIDTYQPPAGAVDPYSMAEINRMRAQGSDQVMGPDGQLKQAGDAAGGGLGKILGLVGLLSDERTKRNLAPGNMSASQAVGALDPYTFEYEAGYGQAPGQHIGVMAQDLEKVAPQAVQNTPQGKMINTAQGTGLALASAADQEKRLRDIESRMGSASGLAAMGSPADNAMRKIQAMEQGSPASVASAHTRDQYDLRGVAGATNAYDPRKETYLGYGGMA